MSDVNLWEIIVSKFDKLDNQVDKLSSKQDVQNEILLRNTITLEEHVKRTNLLEQKLIPIEKHVNIVNGALKFIGGVTVLLSLITGFISLYKYFKP